MKQGECKRTSSLIMLVMGLHNIHLVERLGTRRTLPHAVADAILDAVLTEQVSTGFEDPIFEVLFADGTDRKALRLESIRVQREKGNEMHRRRQTYS
jgi:hypothetical protein